MSNEEQAVKRHSSLGEASRPVVVTGGAGFIGSHLVHKLVAEGRRVVVVDDFSRGQRERLEDIEDLIEIRSVDLRDYQPARSAIEGADYVYHLAARVGNIEFLHSSEEAELAALQSNLAIDANVFRACLGVGVRTVVYASSVSVYPIAKQRDRNIVFAETDAVPMDPDGGYGWAKLLGEIQLQWMRSIRSGVARIFSAYGEGEEPDEFSHAIPALIRKAVVYPGEEFQVWGNGEQSRDYVYVDDVIDVLMRLERAAAWPPLVVNVGGGKAVAIRSLVERIIKISGKNIVPIFVADRLVGPMSRTASIEKAKRLLGWEPKVPLDEGLIRAYLWTASRLTQLHTLS